MRTVIVLSGFETCRTVLLFFFFFQAEDGIRDYKVTGVQTCALPISSMRVAMSASLNCTDFQAVQFKLADMATRIEAARALAHRAAARKDAGEIGRAACRERVEISVVAGSLKKKKERVRQVGTHAIQK